MSRRLPPTEQGRSADGGWAKGPWVLALIVALVVLVVGVALLALSRARPGSGTSRTPPPPAPITSPQSALRQTGWMGYSIDAKFSIMVIAMDDRSADTMNLKSNFDRDCTVMIVSVDNRPNAGPITVTTDGATVRMADNSFVPVVQTSDAAKSDRKDYVARYASPFTVAARAQVDGKLMLLAPGLDMTRVTAVSLMVDGVKVTVPGRVFTAQEKAERLKASRAQQDPLNL